MGQRFASSLLFFLFVTFNDSVQGDDVNLVPFIASLNIVEEAFTRHHCAVKEGSLGNPYSPLPNRWSRELNRKLLRFSVGIENQGTDDLKLRREDHPDWFEWGDCHRHWHFKDFTHYELVDSKGLDVVVGRKQAFCLMDIRRFSSSARRTPRHSCSNPGISAGWADLYSYSLDGQWIDITDVPPGRYSLKVTVNHGNMISETDHSDNTAIVEDVVIPGSNSEENTDDEENEPRSHRNRLPIFSDCASNEECLSEICMHRSGEIKTEPNGLGGRCVCVKRGRRCAGDHNCCDGLRCEIRNNRCRNRQ